MNQVTGKLEFQPAIVPHIYDHDGPMYYADHTSLDFALTPNHGMYVLPRKRRDRPDGNSGDSLFVRTTMDSLPEFCEVPKTTTGWLGTELERLGIGNRVYHGDDFLALVSLVISDGHVGHRDDGNGGRNNITFCCFRDDRVEMVRALAYRLGIPEQSSRPGVWYFRDGDLAEWLRQNSYDDGGYTAGFKRVPLIVKCASERQIRHFLEFFGDQHIQGGTLRRFYSCSRGMAGDLQELLLRVGKRSSLTESPPRTTHSNVNGRPIRGNHPEFIVNENSRNIVLGRDEDLVIDHYKGKVYCATVPNGTLITRRNGKLLISSNCWCFSGTGVIEIAYWKVGKQITLSEQYTLSCGRNGGCNGDDNVNVLAWAKQTGIPLTSDYGPYVTRPGSCNFKPQMTLYKVDDWGFASGNDQQAVTPTDLVKAAIVQYGCVGCAVDAGFNDPGQGVISGRGHNIDHDVILVGYDDSKGNGGAWIMRNSWGTGWGNQGYAWIEYGAYDIGTEAVWAVVNGAAPPIDYYV
jgi:hypothetical protein